MDLAEGFHRVLEQERDALALSCQRLRAQTEAIERTCVLLAGSGNGDRRRVIVSGVGKAGLIARKVSATLSSTGTPATFIHPVDGLHGDIGCVHAGDVVLLFSYSGETSEVIRLARQLCELGCEIVAVTRSQTSSLGRLADACIETGQLEEACYLGLVPTSSTTVMLAIGDALALSVARSNGFQEQDFARNHPAGSLGLKFRRVESAMRTGDRLVCVSPGAVLRHVVERVSQAKTGAAILTNDDGTLCGIFTDGDLRRALLRGSDVLERAVVEYATRPCRFITIDSTLAEAMNLFKQTRIEDLPVVCRNSHRVVGMLCLKDISVF